MKKYRFDVLLNKFVAEDIKDKKVQLAEYLNISMDRLDKLKNARLGKLPNATGEQLLKASIFFSDNLKIDVSVKDLCTEEYLSRLEIKEQVATAA